MLWRAAVSSSSATVLSVFVLQDDSVLFPGGPPALIPKLTCNTGGVFDCCSSPRSQFKYHQTEQVLISVVLTGRTPLWALSAQCPHSFCRKVEQCISLSHVHSLVSTLDVDLTSVLLSSAVHHPSEELLALSLIDPLDLSLWGCWVCSMCPLHFVTKDPAHQDGPYSAKVTADLPSVLSVILPSSLGHLLLQTHCVQNGIHHFPLKLAPA